MLEAHHLIMRFRDNHVFARSQRARCKIANAVLRRDPQFELLTFSGADTHIHALLAGTREAAGEFARRVEISTQLRIRPNVGFCNVHVVPVRDQQHLYNAFYYILRQEQHHGTRVDPYHDMSNLPDLLGLRLLGGWTIPHVRAHLPRVTHRELVGCFGAGRLGAPITNYEPLGDAAMAAGAVSTLSSRHPASRSARVAAVHLASDLGSARLAKILGVSWDSVDRARRIQPDALLTKVVRRQLEVRQPAETERQAVPSAEVG